MHTHTCMFWLQQSLEEIRLEQGHSRLCMWLHITFGKHETPFWNTRGVRCQYHKTNGIHCRNTVVSIVWEMPSHKEMFTDENMKQSIDASIVLHSALQGRMVYPPPPLISELSRPDKDPCCFFCKLHCNPRLESLCLSSTLYHKHLKTITLDQGLVESPILKERNPGDWKNYGF